MSLTPRITIADSSTWIDLHAGGLLAEALRLPLDWGAADVALAEIVEPDSATLLGLGIRSYELSGVLVEEVARLGAVYRALSAVDRACLVLARWLGALLLTSDGPLRRAAETEGLEVRGTLWLLDELIERQHIETARATEALRAMIRGGRRLPLDEVQRRLSMWDRR